MSTLVGRRFFPLVSLWLAASVSAALAQGSPQQQSPPQEPQQKTPPQDKSSPPASPDNKPAAAADDGPKYGPTPSPPGAKVYFVDVKNGATLEPKTTIHFGLRNMGVAPAGLAKPKSGHHHLLVDTDLPPLNKPIPNDFNHLHYGAGQTEAEVQLAPGEHTLQLLLGDKDHIPFNPPVASERIKVTVVDPADPQAKARNRQPSPGGAKVYFVYPSNGSYVPPTVTVRFGLVGMGVAPAGLEKAKTGHHHVIVDAPLPPLDKPIPNDFNHLHFGLGQTEAAVTLPLGVHTLQLLFADAHHVPHDPPVYSSPIKVVVTPTGVAPVPPPVRRNYVRPRPRSYERPNSRRYWRSTGRPVPQWWR